MANIPNSVDGILVLGENDIDAIINTGSDVTISALGGNDTVHNQGTKSVINMGGGDDSVLNYPIATDVLINGGDGDDSIDNYAERVTINGGAGNDLVYNDGTKTYIDLGDANSQPHDEQSCDKVDNYANDVTMVAGKGGALIITSGARASIVGSDSFDVIRNYGADSTIDAGNGNNYIFNGITSVTGFQNPILSGARTSIVSGDGNDEIINAIDHVTIRSGAGNDTIEIAKSSLGGNIDYNFIDAGAGRDFIFTTLGADHSTIDAGADHDEIQNRSNYSSLNAGTGDDVITDWGTHNTLVGGDGNDYLYAFGEYALVEAGSGEDTVTSAHYATVDGGTGNDLLTAEADSSINGGAGADTLVAHNVNSTFVGGAGNDSIDLRSGTNSRVQYRSGDGDDYVLGFTTGDTFQITGGTFNGYTLGNSSDSVNVILKVGSGSITLKDFSGKLLTMKLADGTDTQFYVGPTRLENRTANAVIRATAYNDTVTNYAQKVAINAGDGNDHIYLSESKNGSVDAGAGNDTVDIGDGSSNVLINVGGGNDLITNARNNDSSTLNGGDGDDRIENRGDKNAIDAGAGNDSIVNYGSETRLITGAGNDTVRNRAEEVWLDNSRNVILGGSNVLIDATGGGNNLIENDASNSDVTIVGGTGNDSINNAGSKAIINGGAGDDYVLSTGDNASVNGGAGNDRLNVKGSNVTVEGGAGDDTISLGSGSAVVVKYSSGEGADQISGFDADDTLYIVNGSIDDESLSNNNQGNDVVLKIGSNSVTIKDANGKTLWIKEGSRLYRRRFGPVNVSNTDGNTLISGGNYGDAITNSGANVTINVGVGADSVINRAGGSLSALDGGDGNDYIENAAANVTINGSSGEDKIYNTGSNVSINGGNDNDSITNAGTGTTLSGGDGNDYIENAAANVTINGSSGEDKIYNTGSNVSINGGNDNDSITNAGTGTTLSGGDGNDTIDLSTGSALYQYTSGNDVLKNYSTSDTIKLTSSATDFYTTDGADLIFRLGNDSLRVVGGNGKWINVVDTNNKFISKYYGTVNLNNSTANIAINTGNYGDAITNSGANVTINVGVGADSVINRAGGSLSALDGGDGNDYIENAAANVTINGSSGEDKIYNTGSNVSINGGNDNDSITNAGTGTTLSGGDGNDTIDLGSGGALYQFSSGNDLLLNYSSNDTIKLMSGAFDSIGFGVGNNANDLIIKNGSGLITVKEGKGQRINLVDANGNSSVRTFGGANISVNEQNLLLENDSAKDNVINYAAGATILSGDGDDTLTNDVNAEHNAVRVSEGHYSISGLNDHVVLNGGDGNDRLLNRGEAATVLGGSGDDAIRNSYGTLWLDASRTDTINGSKSILDAGAGNDTIINDATNSDVSINGGTESDYILNNGRHVTIVAGRGNDTVDAGTGTNVIEYAAGDDNDLILNFKADDTLHITDGAIDENAVSVGGINQSDLILKVGSGTITLVGARNRMIKVLDANNNLTEKIYGPLSVINTINNESIDGGVYNDQITNVGSNVAIRSGGGNDTINNSYELATLESGGDSLRASGTKAIVDAGAGNDLINNYGAASSISAGAGNDTINNLSKTYWQDSANTKEATVGGSNATLNGGAGNDRMLNEAGNPNVYMLGGDGADSLNNNGDGSTLSGGAGADTIRNSARNVSIVAGNDNDRIIDDGKGTTIVGGKGNDTVELVDGSNVLIRYAAGDGNDRIKKFSELDTLTVTDGTISGNYFDGDDYVLEITGKNQSGSIVLESVGSSQFVLSADRKTLTFNTEPAPVILNKTKKVLVTGSNEGDSIKNTAANVTIRGNGGNDTITGSTNGEVILYSDGDGSDLITNFGDNDTLKILSGRVSSHYAKGKDYLINIGAGTITLKGAGSKNFNWSDGAFTVNTVPADYNNIFNGDDSVRVSGNVASLGNDYIINEGEGVTIEPLSGDDTITGSDIYGEVFSFTALSDNNVITNFGLNDTLHCSSGSITSYAANGKDIVVTLKQGKTNTATVRLQNAATYIKLIKTTASDLIIDGINQIVNQQSKQKVVGTDGRDYVINTGDVVTIQSGGGNDTITGSDEYGELFVFGAADGDNVITNFGKGDTLRISAGEIASTLKVGNDYMINLKNGTTSGSILLQNAGGYVLVRDDKNISIRDNNYIINRADSIKAAGTSGNDYIINSGEKVTIAPGAGNDTIEGSDYPELYTFSQTDGDNVILNFGNTDSLKASSGTLSTVVSGDDLLVSITKNDATGTVRLRNMGSKQFSVSNNLLTVDYVNTISNADDTVKVNGTSARDYIVNTGEKVTIAPGAGNDTVDASELYGELFQFSYTTGNNLITNFGKNDTLTSSNGTITYKTVGNDVVVSIAKSGKSAVSTITLGGAASYRFINTGSKLTVDPIKYIDNDEPNAKVSGTSGKDYITNHVEGATLNAGAGDDTLDGSNFGEIFQFSYGTGNDVITNFGKNDTLVSSNGTITYETVGNDVVVSINKKGKSAVGKITLQGASDYKFIKSGSTLTVDQTNYIDNFTSNETVKGTSGKDYITNHAEGATIQAGGGNDTVEGSNFGEVFLFNYTSGNDIITNFDENDSLKSTNGTITYEKSGKNVIVTISRSGKSSVGKITLKGAAAFDFKTEGGWLTVDKVNTIINTEGSVDITGTDGRDSIDNTGENVTIIGSAGEDTITGDDTYGELYQFTSLDGGNVITNFGRNDTLQVTSGSISSTVLSDDGNDLIVSLGKKSEAKVTLQGAGAYLDLIKKSGKYLIFDDVNIITNRKNKKKVNGNVNRDYIINLGNLATIDGKGGNDTIIASDSPEVISFGATGGEDVVVGFGRNDSLYINNGSISSRLRVGDDYIVNFTNGKTLGAITLQGAGIYPFIQEGKYLIVDDVNVVVNDKDSIKVSGKSGRDYITNAGEFVTIESGKGNDTIYGSNYGDVYTFSYISGDDVILNFDRNDTLKATSGTISKLETIGADVLVTIKKSGKSGTGTITLKNATQFFLKKLNSTTLIVDDIIKKENADSDTKVSGTSGRDYIINTGENVTIATGKGNDTIIGSELYGEVFQFSYAADENLIEDFGENDTLMSTNGTLSYKKSGKDVVVSISKKSTVGTVTLKGAADYDFVKSGSTLTVEPVNTITAESDDQKLNSTSGRDYIINPGYERVTITGSKGNDTIDGSIFGEVFQFSYGTGNDVITNFGVNDTLRNTSGTLSFKKSGDNYIVTSKKNSTTGTVTLEGAGNLTLIKSGANIVVKDPPKVITNVDDSEKITGTKADEYIYNTGKDVTINAGAGNDTIDGSELYGEVFQFGYASGDDTIMNFGLGDTLQMTSGSSMTYETSGSDYIVTITKNGKTAVGTITLHDAAENYTLKKSGKNLIARPKTTSDQLPSDDAGYWFLESDAEDELMKVSPLSEIVSSNDMSIDLSSELLSDTLRSSAIELISSARSRHKSSQ